MSRNLNSRVRALRRQILAEVLSALRNAASPLSIYQWASKVKERSATLRSLIAGDDSVDDHFDSVVYGAMGTLLQAGKVTIGYEERVISQSRGAQRVRVYSPAQSPPSQP